MREPLECQACEGVAGQRDLLTGDWVDCPRCEGLGVIHRGSPWGARISDDYCPACDGDGLIDADRAAELRADAADTREATDDQRLHARLERDGPQPAPAGGAL